MSCERAFEIQFPFREKSVNALIDTGSSINVIHENMLGNRKPVKLDNAVTAELADGKATVTFTHGIMTTVNVCGPSKDPYFFHVGKPSYDFILGMPWLKMENPTLDFDKLTVSRQAEILHSVDNSTVIEESDKLYLVNIKTCSMTNVIGKLPKSLKSYDDVVVEDTSRLQLPPKRHGFDMTIDIEEGSVIPRQAPYSASQLEQQEINKIINDHIEAGQVIPSKSPYGAPVLLVKKKTGDWRLVVDYRKMNAVTKRMNFPLPDIGEILDALSGSTIFSTMDLASSFNQLRIAPKDTHKSAFRTRTGLYEWVVCPFGLKNCPSAFMKLITHVLQPHINRRCIVYVDDILIYSKCSQEHMNDCKAVLDSLRQAQLIIKASKCNFFAKEVEFLGVNISANGVDVVKERVKKVMDWPSPLKTVKDIQRFLGLCNWYRKFIKNYARIAAPISDLMIEANKSNGTKKTNPKVQWDDKAESSFQQLKIALTSPPVLAFPRFGEPFILCTDASDQAVGCILVQDHGDGRRPIAYESKKFSQIESRWPPREKECYAIIYGLRQFRKYLHGSEVTVETDHQSLKYYMEQPKVSAKLARWLDDVAEFRLTIKYVPGKGNDGPDAISRRDDFVAPEITNDPTRFDVKFAAIKTEQDYCDVHEGFWTNMKINSSDPPPSDDFKRINGLWRKNGTIFVPEAMRNETLTVTHALSFSGHPGIAKTTEIVRRRYWWPGWRQDCKDFVSKCQQCQLVKNDKKKGTAVQLLPVPLRPWESVAIDLLTGLPNVKMAGKFEHG
jgi:hypothetical protein